MSQLKKWLNLIKLLCSCSLGSLTVLHLVSCMWWVFSLLPSCSQPSPRHWQVIDGVVARRSSLQFACHRLHIIGELHNDFIRPSSSMTLAKISGNHWWDPYFCGPNYFGDELCMNKYEPSYYICMNPNILVSHYNYLILDFCHYLILVLTCQYIHGSVLNIINS
jgi:hypothetical protein